MAATQLAPIKSQLQRGLTSDHSWCIVIGVEEIVSWLGQCHLARHGGLFATDCSAGGGKERKMPRSKRTLSLLLPAAFVALTLAAAPSLAVVTNGLRTDPTDPNTAGMDTWPFTTLGNNYYGMNWNYNYQTKGGTSVAIGYFTLLTADHYYIDTVDDGTPTTYNTFLINGDTWRVASSTT